MDVDLPTRVRANMNSISGTTTCSLVLDLKRRRLISTEVEHVANLVGVLSLLDSDQLVAVANDIQIGLSRVATRSAILKRGKLVGGRRSSLAPASTARSEDI